MHFSLTSNPHSLPSHFVSHAVKTFSPWEQMPGVRAGGRLWPVRCKLFLNGDYNDYNGEYMTTIKTSYFLEEKYVPRFVPM